MTDTNQEVRETPEWGDIQSNAIPDLPSKIACEIMALSWTHGGTEDEHAYRYGELQEIVEAALASAPPPAVPDAVGVRATRLTWLDTVNDGTLLKAHTAFFAYAIEDQGENWNEKRFWLYGPDRGKVSRFDTLAEAQAAAQADFDRRILSSIEPTPSPEPQAYYDAILSCLDRYQPMAEKAERRDLVEFMDQLRDEIGNRAPLCKLNRWLGYIQGVLIENGHTDVLIERDWSRPLFRPLDYGERLIGYALPEDVYTGGPRSVPLETWQNNSLFEGLFTQPVYSNVSHEPQASNAGAENEPDYPDMEEHGSDEPLEEALREILLGGQGDDDGEKIMPDFEEGQSVRSMVHACIALLETRRDVIEGYANTEAQLRHRLAGLARASRRFMDLFVADGDPPTLTCDDIDPNELASRYDALDRAALTTTEPQTGERDGDEAQKIREGLAKERHRGDGSLEGQINYLVASLVAWMRTARTVELAANADREALEDAERRLAEVEERAREDAARLDWMEANPGAELAKVGGWDESDDYRWAVHVVHGGRNDREWHEVGSGETARAALDAALRAKPEAQAVAGKEAGE